MASSFCLSFYLSFRPACPAGAAGSAHFVTQPPLCQQAVAERQARRRAALLTYENEEVGGGGQANRVAGVQRWGEGEGVAERRWPD